MSDTPDRPSRSSHAADPAESPLRHPLRAAEHEVDHLREIVDEGESPATPAILVATWVAIVLPLIALVVALAFGIAYLVTGRADIDTVGGSTAQAGSSAGRTILAEKAAASVPTVLAEGRS